CAGGPRARRRGVRCRGARHRGVRDCRPRHRGPRSRGTRRRPGPRGRGRRRPGPRGRDRPEEGGRTMTTAAARASEQRQDEAATSRLGTETTTDATALQTVRRGLALAPEALRRVWITLLLAVMATAGKVMVPIAVQYTLEAGIMAPELPAVRLATDAASPAALLLLTSAVSNILMNRRLFRMAETALATLRKRALRHIHDLSLLTQGTEQRGALVSRVTSDVDTISQFMSFGGIML